MRHEWPVHDTLSGRWIIQSTSVEFVAEDVHLCTYDLSKVRIGYTFFSQHDCDVVWWMKLTKISSGLEPKAKIQKGFSILQLKKERIGFSTRPIATKMEQKRKSKYSSKKYILVCSLFVLVTIWSTNVRSRYLLLSIENIVSNLVINTSMLSKGVFLTEDSTAHSFIFISSKRINPPSELLELLQTALKLLVSRSRVLRKPRGGTERRRTNYWSHMCPAI